MIDIERCKEAMLSAPLCQRSWVVEVGVQRDGTRFYRICAAAALLVSAGMSEALIRRITRTGTETGYEKVFGLVLQATYGIPPNMVNPIIETFDEAPSEIRGVDRVLQMFAEHNEAEERRLERVQQAAVRRHSMMIDALNAHYAQKLIMQYGPNAPEFTVSRLDPDGGEGEPSSGTAILALAGV